ncbi:MAG: type II toxin-antitoxin system RelE/ParE family toxin [Spirochaetes bacterium]|nr:type II toxin-antitoxin system RelE/ParE family toxin [Spirochaetota bacterium]
MSYKIEFIQEALNDFTKLDGRLKKKASLKINSLSENPLLGNELGNKFNNDLSGFYKLYFDNKRYRIVYRILSDSIEIVEIWGIDKRDKEKIYKIVNKRIKKYLK